MLNKEDTEEIVQDSLISALTGLDKFRSDADLGTWLYKIAMNKSKDALKYKSRMKRKGSTVEISDVTMSNNFHPGIQLESKEEVAILVNALQSLPANQKAALVLAKLDHKSYSEIAQLMDTTTKAVEGLVSRAKNNLKTYLINLKI